MASYKSKYNAAGRRSEKDQLSSSRQVLTRLPTRAITPTSAESSIPAPMVSKLNKRGVSKPDAVIQTAKAVTTYKGPIKHNPMSKNQQRAGSGRPVATQNGSLDAPSSRSYGYPGSSRYRLDPSTSVRTPSLVSGSSVSTVDSPRSAMLRKKPSTIGRHDYGRMRSASASSQEGTHSAKITREEYNDPFPGSILGITMPPADRPLTLAHLEPVDHGEMTVGLEAPYQLATKNLGPPTPYYAVSASPSTRYSESPGQFSHSSTPTSMSSHSPGITFSLKTTPRIRQTSPTVSRPPVTRRKTDEESTLREPQGLASVRESTTSSSSASTIRDATKANDRGKASTRAAPPPSPSPRKSSKASVEDRKEVAGSQIPNATSPPGQTPPELAHLLDSPQLASNAKQPSRPIRTGTSDISSLRQPSPIIQSNLTSLSYGHHRRTSSTESHSASSSLPQSRTIPSKPSSRNPSPNLNLSSSLLPISSRTAASTRGQTPDIVSDTERNVRKEPPQPTPSPSKSGSRFAFFSRRTKTEPVTSSSRPPAKLKKGPMAGTGHEGYGRYAHRGRSGSTTSATGSAGRSASADSVSGSVPRSSTSRKNSTSTKGDPELDNFLKDRLTPVPIRGEGGLDCTRSTSSLDSTLDRPSLDRKPAGNGLSDPRLGGPTLLPSALPDSSRALSPFRRMMPGSRRPSDSSDNESTIIGRPTLAARRELSIPDTGNTFPRLDKVSEGKESNWLRPKKVEQPVKPSKPSRKWNFFQRAHAHSPKREESVPDVPITINRQPISRTVAHYAMMENNEQIDLEELDRIMQEADKSGDDQPMVFKNSLIAGMDETMRSHDTQSILLPSPPAFAREFTQLTRSASPSVPLKKEGSSSRPPLDGLVNNARLFDPANFSPPLSGLPIPAPPPSSSPSRPSRLAQVGRIPAVVSKRDRERTLPAQSFSRPFAPTQPSPAVKPSGFNSPASGSDQIQGEPAHLGSVNPQATAQPEEPTDFASAAHPHTNPFSPPEFFSFPPRKNSELSYSSSSGIFSLSASTAIIPSKDAPLSEDEVWNEYDDLIDEVISPKDIKSPISATSSLGAPFQYAAMVSQRDIEASKLDIPAPLNISGQVSSKDGSSKPQILRTSRLLASLHSSGAPLTPISMSEFINGYGERNLSVIDPVSGRLSLPSTHRSSARSSLPASVRLSFQPRHSKSASTGSPTVLHESEELKTTTKSTNRYRDTRLIAMAEHTDGLSMANLRFGALMTSKWLSFGQVLFSPAHLEVKEGNDNRVLIIDGLGKDWSYYVALTYPNAHIYNLGAELGSPPGSSTPGPTNTFSGLSNHRHLYHPSLTSATHVPFPFPKGFFTACVFRFPPLCPDSSLRFAISECKRVLRPGGYLEICAVDLDLVNMGNLARRAIRQLKTRIMGRNISGVGEVSLKPVGDNLVRLVGRRGFESLKSCSVGVPVAGGWPGSQELASSNNENKNTKSKPEGLMSFGDLLSERKNDGSTDENIAKMVARVGRWWYSRCYEGVVPLGSDDEEGADESIWSDGALLRECEKRGTTFKLSICFAQKPMVARRRTVSV
ncbi:hypothetical protein M501DRAFT_936636 [Patellaria atrata CBS 101060]|uniref:Methyltransferase type 11 domain-containing protein n=1 Tax=Patellaria atrata CBS 101060 TaxID=1346257 RepID=A0A9P4S8H3_9PEZI|nr:hypothetical protein M501DRAFT_936636 [Patellaria atrata CBS 101060]